MTNFKPLLHLNTTLYKIFEIIR